MQQNINSFLLFCLFVVLMAFGILVDEQAAKISCAWALAIALMLEFMRVCGGDDDHRR